MAMTEGTPSAPGSAAPAIPLAAKVKKGLIDPRKVKHWPAAPVKLPARGKRK